MNWKLEDQCRQEARAVLPALGWHRPPTGTRIAMTAVLAALVAFPFSGPAARLAAGPSLAETLATARDGDTLLIQGPAVFHERLIVTRRVTLLGTNAPVLDADHSGTALTLAAEGATVRDLTVRNGGGDLGNSDSGIMIAAPGATVSDCRVEGGGFGIYVRGVNDCRIENNTIIGNTNAPAAQRGNGIHLWKTRHNVVAGNVITATRDGAYFSYADDNLIASNRIANTRFGIHYMYSHRNRLLGNALTGNAVGAALMFARDCVVEGNRAFANRRHGLLLVQVESSRIARNTVRGQNRGFFVQLSVGNRFVENVVSENDVGLYLSNGSEENVFVGNAFLHNTDQVWQPPDEVDKGARAANQFYERGRGNFWSDYTGADANRDGIGDTPYHESDVFGYLVERHPAVRLFALSPAVALLRKGEELLPLLDVPGVTDPFPLMNPAVPVPRSRSLVAVEPGSGPPRGGTLAATGAIAASAP